MEQFELEYFPISESARKMLGYVSDGFYDNSYVGKWIFQVMGIEHDKVLEIAEDLPAQFFPETATWGLMYHEIKWGLPVRMNLSYEERRRLIYQKRDSRAPMSPYRMEEYLKMATGFEVRIADTNDPGEYGFFPPHPNVFKAYFIGDGTLDSKGVHEIINQLKQSHTTYTVNDRIEAVLDNRKLESIVLQRVWLYLKVSFWACYTFNGSWLFDGALILNQRRRYGLVAGIRFCSGFYLECEGNMVTGYRAAVDTSELAGAISTCSFNACFSDVPDGRQAASALYIIQTDSGTEEITDAVVITRTKDCWFFDGSIKMDGSTHFNSIYKEEKAE